MSIIPRIGDLSYKQRTYKTGSLRWVQIRKCNWWWKETLKQSLTKISWRKPGKICKYKGKSEIEMQFSWKMRKLKYLEYLGERKFEK